MIHKVIDFGDFLYRKLPKIYRIEDSKPEINLTLKRYLQSLDKGGIQTLFSEMLALYDLFDVNKCPKEVLPILGKLFGYNYIDEVDEKTQRKIISNIAELYKRKGTKSVVKFISREFTMGDTRMVELQHRIFRTYSRYSDLPTSEKELGNIPKTYNPKTNGIDTTTYCIYSKTGKYNGNGVYIIVDNGTQIDLLNKLLADFLPVHCKIYVEVREKGDPIFNEEIKDGVVQFKPLTNLYMSFNPQEVPKEDKILVTIAEKSNPKGCISFVQGQSTTNVK